MNVTEIGTKKSRIHRVNNGSCQSDSAEHKGYDRALTEKMITENNITNASSEGCGLLQQILDPNNLNKPILRIHTALSFWDSLNAGNENIKINA